MKIFLYLMDMYAVKPIVVWHGETITSDLAYESDTVQENRCFTIYNFIVPPGLKGVYDFYALLQKAGHPLDGSFIMSHLAHKKVIFEDY